MAALINPELQFVPTKELLRANDCPTNCDGQHCDKCQFIFPKEYKENITNEKLYLAAQHAIANKEFARTINP